ncbi:hypothetical protein OG474_31125 [Kribbella sp. NBC_01505]|uniref:hypothetical protein n=1 Tax=Kribbella sp. NBC_01505 TaxID=2903580 RepID=UPI0038675970
MAPVHHHLADRAQAGIVRDHAALTAGSGNLTKTRTHNFADYLFLDEVVVA